MSLDIPSAAKELLDLARASSDRDKAAPVEAWVRRVIKHTSPNLTKPRMLAELFKKDETALIYSDWPTSSLTFVAAILRAVKVVKLAPFLGRELSSIDENEQQEMYGWEDCIQACVGGVRDWLETGPEDGVQTISEKERVGETLYTTLWSLLTSKSSKRLNQALKVEILETIEDSLRGSRKNQMLLRDPTAGPGLGPVKLGQLLFETQAWDLVVLLLDILAHIAPSSKSPGDQRRKFASEIFSPFEAGLKGKLLDCFSSQTKSSEWTKTRGELLRLIGESDVKRLQTFILSDYTASADPSAGLSHSDDLKELQDGKKNVYLDDSGIHFERTSSDDEPMTFSLNFADMKQVRLHDLGGDDDLLTELECRTTSGDVHKFTIRTDAIGLQRVLATRPLATKVDAPLIQHNKGTIASINKDELDLSQYSPPLAPAKPKSHKTSEQDGRSRATDVGRQQRYSTVEALAGGGSVSTIRSKESGDKAATSSRPTSAVSKPSKQPSPRQAFKPAPKPFKPNPARLDSKVFGGEDSDLSDAPSVPLETPTSTKQQPERKSYDLRTKPTPRTRTSRTAEVDDKKRKWEADDDDSDRTLKSSLAKRGKSAPKTPGDEETLVVRLHPHKPKGVYSHRGRAPGHLTHNARSSEAPSSSDADTDWDRPPTSAVGTKSAKAREEPTRASGKGGGHGRKKWLSPVAKRVSEKKETAASRRKPVSPSPASRKGKKAAIAANRDKEEEQEREAKKAKRTVAGNMQGKAQTSAPNKMSKRPKESDRRIHDADLNDSDQEMDDAAIQAPVIEDQTVPPPSSAASKRLQRGDERRGQQKVAETERAGSIQHNAPDSGYDIDEMPLNLDDDVDIDGPANESVAAPAPETSRDAIDLIHSIHAVQPSSSPVGAGDHQLNGYWDSLPLVRNRQTKKAPARKVAPRTPKRTKAKNTIYVDQEPPRQRQPTKLQVAEIGAMPERLKPKSANIPQTTLKTSEEGKRSKLVRTKSTPPIETELKQKSSISDEIEKFDEDSALLSQRQPTQQQPEEEIIDESPPTSLGPTIDLRSSPREGVAGVNPFADEKVPPRGHSTPKSPKAVHIKKLAEQPELPHPRPFLTTITTATTDRPVEWTPLSQSPPPAQAQTTKIKRHSIPLLTVEKKEQSPGVTLVATQQNRHSSAPPPAAAEKVPAPSLAVAAPSSIPAPAAITSQRPTAPGTAAALSAARPAAVFSSTRDERRAIVLERAVPVEDAPPRVARPPSMPAAMPRPKTQPAKAPGFAPAPVQYPAEGGAPGPIHAEVDGILEQVPSIVREHPIIKPEESAARRSPTIQQAPVSAINTPVVTQEPAHAAVVAFKTPVAQQPRVRTYDAQPLPLVTPVASAARPVEQEVTNVHEAILAITYRLSDKFERSLEQPRGRVAEIQRVALKDARAAMHKFREKDLHTLSVNEKLDTDIALEEQELLQKYSMLRQANERCLAEVQRLIEKRASQGSRAKLPESFWG